MVVVVVVVVVFVVVVVVVVLVLVLVIVIFFLFFLFFLFFFFLLLLLLLLLLLRQIWMTTAAIGFMKLMTSPSCKKLPGVPRNEPSNATGASEHVAHVEEDIL